MRGKAAGIAVERKVVKRLRDAGWFAVRLPASLGTCDVLAIRKGHPVRMIEVKSTAKGPYAGFPPKDRRELLQDAHDLGAAAFLAWWPPRQQLQMIPARDWPNHIGKDSDLAA